MKSLYIATAILALAALPAFAQAPPPAASVPATPNRPNALVEFPANSAAKLTVTTPAWTEGGDIPFENTMYRGNHFPGLAWTAGPTGTKSYAVIMQDTGGFRNGAPILHWTLYNVPTNVMSLAADMSPTGNPSGSAYGPGRNGDTPQPYTGPRTPPGPKHPYHMQVFALDTILTAPVTNYDTLVSQMKGHILADGEVIGMGFADPTAPPPPPRPATPAPAPAPMPAPM
jgi:para-nitrobenzyl esterase